MMNRVLRRAAMCRALMAASGLALTCPVVADVYDAPPSYYSAATGTGSVLKSQLHTIISTGVIARSYDAARQALAIIDADPNNPANLITVYTGTSISSVWDAGATWNREHTWPDSRGLGGSGPDYTDLHHLHPCITSVNGSRGNDPFGPQSSSFWDPDHLALSSPYRFRGEMARVMFYMDTRYDGSQSGTVDLSLVNGTPSGNQMGDLQFLLEWHYSSPVSERERRRNYRVYSSVANPLYYQNNRNPFIDHPEYVWAIWGTQPNNSTIYVGPSPAPDGSSSAAVNLGAVIVGASLGTQNVTVNKSGSTPTTFDITATGSASSLNAYPRQAFTYNAQSLVVSVGLAGATSPGAYAGSLSIDNTDLTSAAAGQGVADADDVVTVTATVLAHSNGSFNGSSNLDTLTIDLGKFRGGTGLHTQSIDVFNLASVPGFTASLDLDSVTPSGDSAVLGTDLSAPAQIAAGASVPALVWLDTSQPVGTYQAVYSVAVSDQGLPGETTGSTLVLTVQGEVVCPADFNLDNFVTGDDFDGFVEAFELGDAAADFNNDTFVTGDDFDAFMDAFQLGC